MNQSKQQISSLYLLKGICAFLVVTCHAPFLCGGDQAITFLASAAVPFFFTITGYFLYKDDLFAYRERLLMTVKKLLPIICICNVVYFVWIYPKHGSAIQSWQDVFNLIVYGSSIMGVLWYLTASVWGILSIYLLSYLPGGGGRLLVWLLPLTLVSVLTKSYPDVLDVGDPYNALGYSIPYISLGIILRRWQPVVPSFRAWQVGVITLLLFGENLVLNSFYKSAFSGPFLMTLPFVFVVFSYLIKNPNFGKGSWVAELGNKYSGNIYYWHVLMVTVGAYLFRFMGLEVYYKEFSAFVAFMLSYCLAVVIVRLQERLGINILR